MKIRVLRELKSSLLLFLWLLLAQTVCAVFTMTLSILALMLMAFSGTLVLGGSTLTVWGWIACAVPICLFWLVMGRFAPPAVRPGPVGAVAVLAIWAVLTSLMRSADLIFLAQSVCGGMLEQLLCSLSHSPWFDKGRALTVGCYLLPAVFGAGLLLGRKRTVAAGCDGQSG